MLALLHNLYYKQKDFSSSFLHVTFFDNPSHLTVFSFQTTKDIDSCDIDVNYCEVIIIIVSV